MVLVNPPSVYYGLAPPYDPPPATYGWNYYEQPAGRPRLSDMQQRALDSCSLLASHEQRKTCQATELSTAR